MTLPTILKTSLNRKQARALVGLATVFLILPLVSLAVQYPQRYRGRAAAEAPPENVAITNIYSQGFSVSWTTDVATTGYLAWGTTNSSLNQTQGDDRTVTVGLPGGDPTLESRTHHITVATESHPSNGEFFFTVHSGTKDYGGLEVGNPSGELFRAQPSENGAAIRVPVPTVPIYDPTQDPSPANTPGAYSTEQAAFGPCPTGELDTDDNPIMNDACFRPYPIWGQVFESNFSNPINGALVYVWIFDSETNWRDNPKSSLLSTIANEQGQWSLELANALDYTDLTKYLAYQTDFSPTGGNQTPDKLLGLVGDGRTPPDDAWADYLNLHRVTDTTPCTDSSGNIQRNTCTDHDRCSMELPSPICINIGTGPSCEPGSWEDVECGGTHGNLTCADTEILQKRSYTPAGCQDDDYRCTGDLSCASDGDLVFHVKLQGGGRREPQPATVKVGDQQFETRLMPSSDGKFIQILDLSETSLVGDLTFKVKVDGYLQRVFETTIVPDQTNVVDWSDRELLAGDFNGDNKITLDDFTGNMGILRAFGETISIPRTAANEIFDLNDDQKINVVDVSIVLTNFSGVEVSGED